RRSDHLGLEESLEERAVPLQGHPEVLRRDVCAARPLLLELRACAVEARRQIAEQLGDERVRLAHGVPRLVDESRLQPAPPFTELLLPARVEERLEPLAALAAADRFVTRDRGIGVVRYQVARLNPLFGHERASAVSVCSTSASNRER